MLFCCWCAQDLPANHFWESMGFVPIAFRAGSTGKRRVHIFWQRRINDGDTTTPYWYPSMTNQGAIREDRLVFPIPPGTHWSEVRAVAIPAAIPAAQPPALEAPVAKAPRSPKATTPRPAFTPLGGFRFQADQPPAEPYTRQRVAKANVKVKIDPALASKDRELRDRCVERQDEWLPSAAARGKYDVARALGVTPVAGAAAATPALPLLKAG
jgi:hypothetical protein